MADDRFVPDAITVPVGTTVTWVNKGSNQHSIAAYDHSFESGTLETGDRFSHTFSVPGTVRYLCKHHARHGMIGSVTVDGARDEPVRKVGMPLTDNTRPMQRACLAPGHDKAP
jgi:plastocyanin